MANVSENEKNSVSLPYMQAYGSITKTLEAVQKATTPDRFTYDFLATKLGIKASGARPVIPFLKRIGFLGTDGAPTELYKQFRNPASRGAAAAAALRKGYAPVFEINEYAHTLGDTELKGAIIQATGLSASSRMPADILSSFKALNAFADFDAAGVEAVGNTDQSGSGASDSKADQGNGGLQNAGLNLGYTINLNLPATSDVAVFNAIFKSLRENLLEK